MCDEKLLLLDEPVTGLDPIVTAEFYQLIQKINRESGIAVVMVSHDIESAVEYASHILHLQETVLYFGKASQYKRAGQEKHFSEVSSNDTGNYRDDVVSFYDQSVSCWFTGGTLFCSSWCESGIEALFYDR